MIKLDKRREYFIVLDTETASLPCAAKYSGKARQSVSIAKPLVYDLGWTIIDRQGRIYDRKNFLISEIFSVPAIFDTAYYAYKRPLYLEKLERGEIVLTDWRTATAALEEALSVVEGVGAYNAAFDFKKAIPFTELYISYLYSPELHEWLAYQERICNNIANGVKYKSTTKRALENDIFRFHGKEYPLFDIWNLACKHVLNSDEYRETCREQGWKTESGKYYKTSAETAFRFIMGENDFEEAHTALNDAEIESAIFGKICGGRNKKNLEYGIVAFPFRIVGRADI